MVIQIDAEPNDTLESCTATAATLAKTLGMNVTFYYNRIGYYVTPAGGVFFIQPRLEPMEKKGK